MKTKIKLVLVGTLTLAMSACSPITGSKQGDGTLIGGSAGAVIGSAIGSRFGLGGQIIGTVGGALIGAAVGGSIGASLDEQDRLQLEAMTNQSLATGSSRSYTSPRTGVRLRTKIVKRPSSAPPLQTAQICKSVEQTVILADGSEKQETINSCRVGNVWQSA